MGMAQAITRKIVVIGILLLFTLIELAQPSVWQR
jgi:hypothetical protein